MPKAPPKRIRLTDPFVRQLKPDDRTFLVWDTAQGGLGLQVTPTGAKSWKVVYRHHGRLRWYHIDRYPALGVSEAREAARKVRAQAALGSDPQADKLLARMGDSLTYVHSEYLSKWAKEKNRSWRQADALLRNYVLPSLGSRKAREIVRSDIRTLFRRLTTDNGPVLANQVLAALSAVFSWAIKEELVTGANPCHGIERNKTNSRERVLSDREIPPLWTAFDNLDPIVGSALKVLLLTGQRLGEVCAMQWDLIDPDGWWTLPGEPVGDWPGTKNKQTHRVYLSQPVRDILSNLEDVDSTFCFARHKHSIDGSTVSRAMREVCKSLDFNERTTAHDLRRTHGTTITSLGFTREAMNRIQNHKEGGIGSVYDRHDYADEAKAIQERVADRLMAIVEGRVPANAGNVTTLKAKERA